MSIREAIGQADADFCITLGNKGLYNRALREWKEAGITLDWGETGLAALFADGTRVEFSGRIQDCQCSCPSRSVCKHVLMAILAAQADRPTEQTDTPTRQTQAPDYTFIIETTPSQLTKLAGKKKLTAALFALQSGSKAAIEEGSVLTVALSDSGYAVRFLPGGDVADASCSCKAPDFCVHRTEAVLQVMVQKSGRLPEAFLPKEESEPQDFQTECIPYLQNFVRRVLEIGLARLPEDMPGRFLQLGVICHSQRQARLERLCNRVSGRLELYFARKVSFDRDALLGDLTDIYTLCPAIEGGAADKAAVGVFKDSYEMVQSLTLYGLGAYRWHTDGGYTGVTLFFYEPNRKQTLRYTVALPDDTNPDPERIFDSAAPWGAQMKLSGLCHALFTLQNGKLNARGQLSSSNEGHAHLTGGADWLCQPLAPLRYRRFDRLVSALWRAEENGEDELLAILCPDRWEEGVFDSRTQRWHCAVSDSEGRELLLEVRYSNSAKTLIDNLSQKLPKGRHTGSGLLTRIRMSEGRLTGFPVTLYGKETLHLGFTQKDRRKGGYYDWNGGVI